MVRDKRSENNNLQGEIWNTDDDVLLAEVILRNVREGKTVMDGCREMETITDGKRTAAACKFRWFTKLVDQYKAGYEIAKEKGKVVRQAKRRKINKGERYKEIIEEVLDKEVEVEEKEIEPDDFIVLAKKFKEQQSNKIDNLNKLEKEVKQLQRENKRLEKELKEVKEEAKWYNEMLLAKQRDYNKIVEALQTLKNLGVNISIPEPETPKYRIEKDGTVTKL